LKTFTALDYALPEIDYPESVMTTIRDVASLAGVSVASVSRVVNDSRAVQLETRERVEWAIQELGYVPNEAARSLKLARSNLLACVIPDVANPFFPELVRGVEDIASAEGYGTLLCNTDDDSQKEADYLDLLAQRRIDGLLLIPSRDEQPPSGLVRLQKQGTPVVVMDRLLEGFDGDSIVVDNRRGGALAAEHLVALGHSRIAIINRSLDTSSTRLRHEGYEEVLGSVGILDESLVVLGSYSFDFGRDAARELLTSPTREPPSAILAGSDVLAIGALQVAHELGLHVPHDLSIVGFDRIAMSQLMSPPLTTVEQPIYEMARLAADLLVDRATGETTERRTRRTLQPTLHVAASTGPPK
jgi:LacI family transcriptional regulator